MIACKIAAAAIMAGAVVALMAAYDTWRNRERYEARERRRKAKGGLD